GSLRLQARAERFSGRPGRRDVALGALSEAARITREVGGQPEELAELHDEVIAALALPDDRKVPIWWDRENSLTGPAFSIAAGLYVRTDDGAIHVHRIADSSEVRTLATDRPARRWGGVLIPGGRFLIVASGSSIERWDLERGEIPAAWPADVRCAAPRADGGQVAAWRPDGEVRVYDLPAMTEAARFRLRIDAPRVIPSSWMAL